MFIRLVIYHSTRYYQFDVERLVFRTKDYVLGGIINTGGKVLDQIAYSLASFPFIFIFFQLFRLEYENFIQI